ncbi:hypothetical protein QA000_22520, partial [Salmonella enterica]|nr:hypothetical protein [Salmonella enterica]MDI9199208.1 hypothetical protein [Salmonella enterica]
PQNDVTLKMPAFEWVHVQLHQQKGMISLSPPTICNSAHHITLEKGESLNFQLHGPRAYLQSIHGTFHAMTHNEEREALTCGDGAFIRDEPNITLVADTPLRALLVDLPV